MVIILKFDITVDDQINKKIDEIDISNKKLESNIKELHRIIEYLVKSNELLVKKNNQLETQNQMQKEFISITAHDLRTSIQSIIWYSELLEIDPQLCEKYVNLIIRNIKRLERLTQNILDVARIENNLLRLDKQRFNLENLILLVINEYKQQLDKDEKSNDLQITYENPKQDDKGIIIYADKARVTQVISNLIENAIKFTTKGKITITIDKKNNKKNDDVNTVTVNIYDTGSGIHPDVLPRLFSKFATKSVQGTGLGLFISKSILDAHGCKIWAENNTDGKGATFTFNLPCG